MRYNMKRIKFYIATLGLLLGLGVAAVIPAPAAWASPKSVVCGTLGAGSGCTNTPANGVNLNTTLTGVVNILSVVVGVTAVIMIIVAGFRFVTSAGDSSSIASARSTMIYALVGLAIVLLSQTIVKFVLDRITH
jgi:hypothetical protein